MFYKKKDKPSTIDLESYFAEEFDQDDPQEFFRDLTQEYNDSVALQYAIRALPKLIENDEQDLECSYDDTKDFLCCLSNYFSWQKSDRPSEHCIVSATLMEGNNQGYIKFADLIITTINKIDLHQKVTTVLFLMVVQDLDEVIPDYGNVEYIDQIKKILLQMIKHIQNAQSQLDCENYLRILRIATVHFQLFKEARPEYNDLRKFGRSLLEIAARLFETNQSLPLFLRKHCRFLCYSMLLSTEHLNEEKLLSYEKILAEEMNAEHAAIYLEIFTTKSQRFLPINETQVLLEMEILVNSLLISKSNNHTLKNIAIHYLMPHFLQTTEKHEELIADILLLIFHTLSNTDCAMKLTEFFVNFPLDLTVAPRKYEYLAERFFYYEDAKSEMAAINHIMTAQMIRQLLNKELSKYICYTDYAITLLIQHKESEPCVQFHLEKNPGDKISLIELTPAFNCIRQIWKKIISEIAASELSYLNDETRKKIPKIVHDILLPYVNLLDRLNRDVTKLFPSFQFLLSSNDRQLILTLIQTTPLVADEGLPSSLLKQYIDDSLDHFNATVTDEKDQLACMNIDTAHDKKDFSILIIGKKLIDFRLIKQRKWQRELEQKKSAKAKITLEKTDQEVIMPADVAVQTPVELGQSQKKKQRKKKPAQQKTGESPALSSGSTIESTVDDKEWRLVKRADAKRLKQRSMQARDDQGTTTTRPQPKLTPTSSETSDTAQTLRPTHPWATYSMWDTPLYFEPPDSISILCSSLNQLFDTQEPAITPEEVASIPDDDSSIGNSLLLHFFGHR